MKRKLVLRDGSVHDTVDIVRLLIETKEQSFVGRIGSHDRDLDFWVDRWQRYIEHGSSAQHALGDGFAILAVRDGQLVGFAAYHHTRRWKCDAELESIYVRFEHQGSGVGTTLLAEVFRRLRSDGSSSLCVGYSPVNPYKRFYIKYGAVEINPHWAVWRSL